MSRTYEVPFKGVMVVRARSKRKAEEFVENSNGAPIDNEGTLEDLEVLPRPHKPSARCVDTCENPLICREQWEARR